MDLFTEESTIQKGEIYHSFRKELYDYLETNKFRNSNGIGYYVKDYELDGTDYIGNHFGILAVETIDSPTYEDTPDGCKPNGDGSISVFRIYIHTSPLQQMYRAYDDNDYFDTKKSLKTLENMFKDFAIIRDFIEDWTKRYKEAKRQQEVKDNGTQS